MSKLKDTAISKGVKLTSTRTPQRTDGVDTWSERASHWVCILERNGRRMSVQYSQGEAFGDTNAIGYRIALRQWRNNGSPRHAKPIPPPLPPAIDDLLACLLSDARSGRMTFAEHCDEFGLDTDSRKALATWETCVKIAGDLTMVLGDAYDAIETAAEDY